MAEFSLGGVTLLVVTTEPDFEYPPSGQAAVLLIGDGTATDMNEALQSGPLPRRQAPLEAILDDELDIDDLRGFYVTKETVVLSYPDASTVSCIVWECRIRRAGPGHWTAALVLKETESVS
jgi:hypothetical protein